LKYCGGSLLILLYIFQIDHIDPSISFVGGIKGYGRTCIVPAGMQIASNVVAGNRHGVKRAEHDLSILLKIVYA
jgi:hypothetical protein